MIDRNLARGMFLMAIALAFGLPAARYPVGSFSRPGPGLFPLLVCALLFLIGVTTVVRTRFTTQRLPLEFNVRNIAIILGSLCGCVVVSLLLNMTLGIVFLVFCSTLAGTSYSVVRNLKVSAGLIAVAFAFHRFLGLNLPLY
jgi:hypothetical protein